MTVTAFDVQAARAQFPQLQGSRHHEGLAFLDNAAGALMPRRTVAAITDFLTRFGAMNAGMGYPQSDVVLEVKTRARAVTATFLNAHPHETVLGPSASALAFRLAGAFARRWGPGDEVIVSELEHEANASPWRELERVGVRVKLWRARQPDLSLHVDDLRPLLTGRTRLLALCAAANSLGVAPPVAEAARAAREAGTWTVVDAVHSAPHQLPDVQAWNADFVLFSPYKVFAPHLGALYVRGGLLEELPAQKLEFVAEDDPAKLEHGTTQYELWAGWLATLDYLSELGGGPLSRAALQAAYQSFEAHERDLTRRLLDGLTALDGVTLYGPAGLDGRVGTVAFRVRGHTPQALAQALGERGVCVAGGHFYAVLPMRALGLYPGGVVRASLAHYNTREDIGRLLAGVAELARS